MELGRRDTETASANDANTNLPAPTLNLTAGLENAFSRKNFTIQEMVVLSGGHTIGQAHCTTFRNRIYNETNTNRDFATELKGKCPRKTGTAGDNNLAPFDQTTNTFDNTYFRDLINQKGLLHSDQQLVNNGKTDYLVRRYSSYPQLFLRDFGNAMLKMGRLGPLTGSSGVIRPNCTRVN